MPTCWTRGGHQRSGPPCHWARRQRGAARTAFLDEDGLNALLAAARHRAAAAGQGSGAEGDRAARTHAVLAVLVTTAVRAAAIQQARVGDVRGVQAGHRVLTYATKGGDQKYKPLVPYAAAAVDDYLARRAARAGMPLDELDPDGLAFVTTPYHGRPGGTALSSGTLAEMVRETARAAGIGNADELVPHSLRHTTATPPPPSSPGFAPYPRCRITSTTRTQEPHERMSTQTRR